MESYTAIPCVLSLNSVQLRSNNYFVATLSAHLALLTPSFDLLIKEATQLLTSFLYGRSKLPLPIFPASPRILMTPKPADRCCTLVSSYVNALHAPLHCSIVSLLPLLVLDLGMLVFIYAME
jgi:hypothetical protein